MRDEAVNLDEGAFVEEHLDALAGGELALVVLGLESGGAAAEFGLGAALGQEVEFLAH
jgi:hypothetical protein